MNELPKLTVEEVREERRVLATKILELVKGFNERTGLSAGSINLVNVDHHPFGGPHSNVLADVEIELYI